MVLEEFQAGKQREDFALLQEVSLGRALVALQVLFGGELQDHETSGVQHGGQPTEEGTTQEVEPNDEIPWPVRNRVLFQVGFHQIDCEAAFAGSGACRGQCHVGDVDQGYIEAALGQPERIASRPARHVDGRAVSRQRGIECDEKS